MKVKDAPCVAAMEKMENMLMVLISDPLEWSFRHLLTEACKRVESLSKYLESCSTPTEIRMCLAGMVN